MKSLYDGFIYRIQTAGGINRYLANLIGRLPEDWTPVLTAWEKMELAFPEHSRLRLRSFPMRRGRPRRLFAWLATEYFRSVEAYERFGLIHRVYHFSLTGTPRGGRRRVPVVLTIHDMIPELFAEDIDPTGAEAQAKRQAIEAADAIICVSENTRRDLLERHRIPEDRVFVTPLASELSAEMATGPEPVPARPYFLFVGSRAIYKNFVRLLLAFAQVAEQWPEVEMDVVGRPFLGTELSLLDALHIRRRVHNLGCVADSHLAKLYRSSVAFVYPSLYEGFGIPPLEALACGAYVITSACSSLPEVVGDAAVLVDPTSVDGLAAAMLHVRDLSDDERRKSVQKGMARARRFDWGRTVRQTLEVYRAVAGVETLNSGLGQDRSMASNASGSEALEGPQGCARPRAGPDS
jgi:glycosyltransferase involved in cell wall biosynthesis